MGFRFRSRGGISSSVSLCRPSREGSRVLRSCVECARGPLVRLPCPISSSTADRHGIVSRKSKTFCVSSFCMAVFYSNPSSSLTFPDEETFPALVIVTLCARPCIFYGDDRPILVDLYRSLLFICQQKEHRRLETRRRRHFLLPYVRHGHNVTIVANRVYEQGISSSSSRLH